MGTLTPLLLQVYGPHASALYVRKQALLHSLSSLAHHFLNVDAKPYKLQPGGPGYEVVYGCTAVPPYLRGLAPSGDLQSAFKLIARHEQSLIKPLLSFLKSKEERGVRIVGEEHASANRIPTVSFVVVGDRAIKSQYIVEIFDKKGEVSASPEPVSTFVTIVEKDAVYPGMTNEVCM